MAVRSRIRSALLKYRDVKKKPPRFTQADMAAKLGIGLRAYAELESGRVRQPRRETLEALTKLLGLSSDVLLELEP